MLHMREREREGARGRERGEREREREGERGGGGGGGGGRERERFMCCDTPHTATSGDLQREAYPQEHASTSQHHLYKTVNCTLHVASLPHNINFIYLRVATLCLPFITYNKQSGKSFTI